MQGLKEMPDCSTCYCGIFGGTRCMSGYKPETCTHWRLRYTCMGGKIFDEPLEKAPGCRLLLDRCEPCCKYGKGCLRMDVLFGKFTAEEIMHLLTEQDKQFLGIQRGVIDVPKRKSVAAEETMAEVRFKELVGQAQDAAAPSAQAGTCRVCGCTDDHACITESGIPCAWLEPDLCSNCVTFSCAKPGDACPHCKVLGKLARREPSYPACMGCESLKWEEKRQEPAQEAAPTGDAAVDPNAFDATARLAIEKGWLREVPLPAPHPEETAAPAEKDWMPRCPFLSSIGEKEITCTDSNCATLGKKEFNREKDCRDKVDSHCYGRFCDCEDYRKYYAENAGERTCIHCCNTSWHTGLPAGYSGQEYCFCQLKQEPMGHKDSCEWFNRHPDWKLNGADPVLALVGRRLFSSRGQGGTVKDVLQLGEGSSDYSVIYDDAKTGHEWKFIARLQDNTLYEYDGHGFTQPLSLDFDYPRPAQETPAVSVCDIDRENIGPESTAALAEMAQAPTVHQELSTAGPGPDLIVIYGCVSPIPKPKDICPAGEPNYKACAGCRQWKPVETKKQSGYATIPTELLYPNPANPRQKFDPDELDKLAESIKAIGILEPILCVRDDSCCILPYGLRIVCGERRWRAAIKAELKEVPVIVRDLTPDQEFEVMLTENIQRADLDPIEEAQAFRAAVDRGWKQEALAEKLGISQAQVANRLRLLKLPDQVQELISREIMAPSQALMLVKVAHKPEIVQDLAKKLEGVPVASSEELIETNLRNRLYNTPLSANAYRTIKFNTEDCDKCPNRIMVKDYGGKKQHPYCMDKTCWEAKQRAAEASEVNEHIQAALGDEAPSDVPYLRDLDGSAYERFWNRKAEECAGCEHLKPVIDYQNQIETVCMDPACMKKKTEQATQAQKDARKRERQAWEDRIQELQGLADEPLSLLFTAARAYSLAEESFNPNEKSIVERLCEYFHWELPTEAEGGDEKEEMSWLVERFRKLPIDRLLTAIYVIMLGTLDRTDWAYKLTLGAAAGAGEDAEAIG